MMNEFVGIVQYRDRVLALTRDGKVYEIATDPITEFLQFRFVGQLPRD